MPHRPIHYADPTLDRACERRADADWIAERLAEPATRVALTRGGSVGVDSDSRAPVWLRPHELPDHAHRLFIGVLDGIAHFAALVDEPYASAAGVAFIGLRDIVADLPHGEGAVLAYANGLSHWHGRNGHCAVCGAPTAIEQAGHVRRCTSDACRAMVFPRTDPAVITLVIDGDRCLLARRRVWPENRRSTIAGFVEPGETLEHAVVREVFEEVGVHVERPTYRGSQPWPFPQSLMLGFWAEATSTAIDVDGDEIAAARWYTAAQIRADHTAGDLVLPPSDSISRRLVDDWLEHQGV